MATGILLQPEFIISYLKSVADDPRLEVLRDLFDSSGGDYYPTMSVIGYGLTRESIIAAADLNQHDRREMGTRLRTLRRDLKRQGHFHHFEKDSADEWAILRDECSSQGIRLDAERQLEYAVALATNQAILAPLAKQDIYLPYSSIPIEYR